MPTTRTTTHRPDGFTLIELITVIAIVGILAAAALPRFVNLRRDALLGTTVSLRGALQSAADLGHAKAIVAGITDQASATLTIDGQAISFAYGYPAGTATGIVQLVTTPAGDWNQRASSIAGAWVYWHGVIDEDAWDAQCFIRYRQASAAGNAPVIDYVSSGCLTPGYSSSSQRSRSCSSSSSIAARRSDSACASLGCDW
ncbi:MAG: type II secretion system protein [Propionivibrio sp.]